MSAPNRYQAKRDGARGAQIKDVQENRVVATFPPDPKRPDMPMRYAEAAAATFNTLHAKRIEARKKMGFGG